MTVHRTSAISEELNARYEIWFCLQSIIHAVTDAWNILLTVEASVTLDIAHGQSSC